MHFILELLAHLYADFIIERGKNKQLCAHKTVALISLIPIALWLVTGYLKEDFFDNTILYWFGGLTLSIYATTYVYIRGIKKNNK